MNIVHFLFFLFIIFPPFNSDLRLSGMGWRRECCFNINQTFSETKKQTHIHYPTSEASPFGSSLIPNSTHPPSNLSQHQSPPQVSHLLS